MKSGVWRLCVLAAASVAACSTQKIHEKLDPTARAVQPAVNAFECGGKGVKTVIASCRADGGTYGHCVVLASRAGVSDATRCYDYADAVRRRREQLVLQEDTLDAQSSYLKDVNHDTETLNADLAVRIDDVTARTDMAKESIAQGQMTGADLQQLHEILDIELSSAQKQVDVASRELQAALAYRSRQAPPTPVLDEEISQLQAMLNEAQRKTAELVAQRQRL